MLASNLPWLLLHLRNRQSPCGVQREAGGYSVGLVNCKVARIVPRADKVKICRSAPELGTVNPLFLGRHLK